MLYSNPSLKINVALSKVRTTINKALMLLPACALSSVFAFTAQAEVPIYAAYVSEDINQHCETSICQLNPFDGEQLSELAAQLKEGKVLAEALALSDYEVLIGNALINITDNKSAELVLEITTSWRQVPIDDIELKAHVELDKLSQSAQQMLSTWAQHLETNKVLDADRIYQVLEASDYAKELAVPKTIGDFVLQGSATYRDPLLGSITRYVHPQFADAIVDISVYPFSPFANTEKENSDDTLALNIEMDNERNQIAELINQANIQDYKISDIQATEVTIGTQKVRGLRMEVLLNTQTDPVYSTQYVFKQNDKIIKLTGNLPEFMMSALVSESLPQIRVPAESVFMRGLRQG